MSARRTARPPVARCCLPLILAELAGLVGYFGPWVPHGAAGLAVTGLDLAEYVKFLPPVMSGQIVLRREVFYLPLLAASLTSGLLASRRTLPRWSRAVLASAAIPLALAMLPPAWSPATLLLPEFRLQVIAIVICLANLLLIPLTRYLPDRIALLLIAGLSLIATLWPAWSFLRVQPAIAEIYRQALPLGWGFWAAFAGGSAVAVIALAGLLRPTGRQRPVGQR